MEGLLPVGDYVSLAKIKLNADDCRKWGYSVSKYKGETVQIANYRDADTGEIIWQKVRPKDKDKTISVGDAKKPGLYGEWLWRDGGRKVVITEGEKDAISVSKLQDHRWPVVSVPNGAAGAKKAIERRLAWLDKFAEVVLMFDNDQAGRDAVAECAPLFPPGRCKVARLPLKDANDMLQAGRGDEVITAIWEAKTYRPDAIVTLSDLRQRILTPPQTGLPWFHSGLTKLTYGRRFGEVYGWGAGSGIGKTDVFAEQIKTDLTDLGLATGIFSFEQNPAETAKRVAGKLAGKRFHIPGDVGGWQQAELEATLDTLEQSGKLFLYDSFGAMDWNVVRGGIRFLAHSEGVKVFYIDNITSLAAGEDDEQAFLKKLMAEMASLAQELGVIINYVSHLTTPKDGPPHEAGGRVHGNQFRGSRVIMYWSNFMFGIERNTESANDDIVTHSTIRCVKDRNTGDSTGKCVYLKYDRTTGRMVETDDPPPKEEEDAEAYGLGDKARANPDF